jgi:hypothetical protein
MPEFVYLGLWGLGTRRAALAFMWGCVALGAASLVAALRHPPAALGAGFFAAAWWYWHSIRWVDEHSSWTRP